MIRFYIDGALVESVKEPKIAVVLSAEAMRSCEVAAESCDYGIEVEADVDILDRVEYEGFVNGRSRFNSSSHSGRLMLGDELIAEGRLTLTRSRSGERGARIYTFNLHCSGAMWAVLAAERLLHESPIAYDETLNMTTIEESWEGDGVVKFIPVHRDNYVAELSSVSVDTVRRLRGVDDYHPFLHLRTMLYSIFNGAGYDVESRFLESEFAQQLYMSGAYRSQGSDVAKSRMDFYVKRMEDRSTTADFRGRVTFSDGYYSSSVGCMVDLESLEQLAECYTLGGCLSMSNGELCFTPLSSLSVGFEYRLHYTAEYRIKSRTRLQTFDTLYLGSGSSIQFDIVNRFEDWRGEPLISQFEYLVVAFDAEDDAELSLWTTVDGEAVRIGEPWSGRIGRVATPQLSVAADVTPAKLYRSNGVGGYEPYSEDWALYMGSVDECGDTEVDITIRTPPEPLSPDNPKLFNAPYIEGGELLWRFTMKSGCSVRPYFASYPGYGSQIGFEDIAQHGCYQAKLVEAARHLFNLAIYTDPIRRCVIIEPEGEIYDASRVWDWSDRVDLAEEVEFEDVAFGSARMCEWGYQQSDGVTYRSNSFGYLPDNTYPPKPEPSPEQSFEGATCEEYGSWRVPIENYAAKATLRRWRNPLFAPTQCDTLGFPIVGDRDNPEFADTLNFSPRVVVVRGTIESENMTLPRAMFYDDEQGVSLCFEDRGQVVGLNRYYHERVRRDRSGVYVTATLRIKPHELVMLQSPDADLPNMLSTFKIKLQGEWLMVRIERLEVEVGGGERELKARCKFLIINELN